MNIKIPQIFTIYESEYSAKIKLKLRKKQNKRARRLPSSSLKLELKGISGGGAVDPERITRGVISLTTGDSRRGSLGSIFRFLSLCVCLGVQRGLSRVLIKYSGNVRLQIIFEIHHMYFIIGSYSPSS